MTPPTLLMTRALVALSAPRPQGLARVLRRLSTFDPRAELDHVAIGIAEVDRVNRAVIGDAASLDALRFALFEHRHEHVGIDLEGDVKIEVVLVLERERHARCLEEREMRAIV